MAPEEMIEVEEEIEDGATGQDGNSNSKNFEGTKFDGAKNGNANRSDVESTTIGASIVTSGTLKDDEKIIEEMIDEKEIQTKEMIPEETAVKLFQLEGPEGAVIALTGPSLYDCKKYAYTKAKCYPNIACFGADSRTWITCIECRKMALLSITSYTKKIV